MLKKLKIKKLSRLGMSVLTLFVIWNFLFFQCLAPLFYSKALAEEETGSEETVSEPSDGSGEENKTDEDGEENNEEVDEESEEESKTQEDQTRDCDQKDSNCDEDSKNDENPEVDDLQDLASAEINAGDENKINNEESGGGDSENITGLVNEELFEELANNIPIESEADEKECFCDEIADGNKIEDISGNENENQCLPDEDCAPTLPDPDDYCVKVCEEIKIHNENDTEAENKADSDSNTGNNEINLNDEENNDPGNNALDENFQNEPAEPILEETASDADILSGEAQSAALIINDINSNKIGCNFSDLIYNITGQYSGDINLYEEFVKIIENSCSSFSHDEIIAILVENINSAEITNSADANSQTGENSIQGAASAGITTGDAAALAEIINIINRNLVGDNWVFSMINVLGEWSGNLIVPGEGLLNIANGSQDTSLEVINKNTANVSNEAVSEAQTGNNIITNANSAGIQTGDALSYSNVINVINTNIVKNNWFFLMINNAGSWVGNVLNWNFENNVFSNIFEYDFGIDGLSKIADGIGGILRVKNTNNAQVENSASAAASTGNNSIYDSDSAEIKTGNATAISHILNFINTNMVGNNWFFGIVNVFGSWKGNLEFAYPDLAIDFSDNKNDAAPGETVEFLVNVQNNGEAPCDDAKIMISLPDEIEYLSDTSGTRPVSQNGGLIWNLPGIENNGSASFKVKAKITETLAPGNYIITSAAGVTTSTKEVELGNNSTSDTTKVSVLNLLEGSGLENNNLNTHLSITRSVDKSGRLNPGELVKHTFFITNKSDVPLYNVVLEDIMKDENGADLTIYQWEIGDMQKGQKIMVDYTLQVNNIGRPVTFVYEAQARGEDPNEDEVESRKVGSLLTILGFVNSAQAFEAPPTEIAGAEAASLPETIQSAAQNSLPLWIFLAALAAYYLAINWSLARNKISHKK